MSWNFVVHDQYTSIKEVDRIVGEERNGKLWRILAAFLEFSHLTVISVVWWVTSVTNVVKFTGREKRVSKEPGDIDNVGYFIIAFSTQKYSFLTTDSVERFGISLSKSRHCNLQSYFCQAL